MLRFTLVFFAIFVTSATNSFSAAEKPNSPDTYCATVKQSKIANGLANRYQDAFKKISTIQKSLMFEDLTLAGNAHDKAKEDFLSGYSSDDISSIPQASVILKPYQVALDEINQKKQNFILLKNELNQLRSFGIDSKNRETAKQFTAYLNSVLPCNSPSNCPQRFITGPYLVWFAQCAKQLSSEQSPLLNIFADPSDKDFAETLSKTPLQSKNLIQLFLSKWGTPNVASWAATGMNQGKVISPPYLTPLMFVLSETNIEEGPINFDYKSRFTELDTLLMRLDEEAKIQATNADKVNSIIAAVKNDFNKAKSRIESKAPEKIAFLQAQKKLRDAAEEKAKAEKVAKAEAKKQDELKKQAERQKKAAENKAYRESAEGRLLAAYRAFQVIKTCHDMREGKLAQIVSKNEYLTFRSQMKEIEEKLQSKLKSKNSDQLWAEAESNLRSWSPFGGQGIDLISQIQLNNRNSFTTAKKDCEVFVLLFNEEYKVVVGSKNLKKDF